MDQKPWSKIVWTTNLVLFPFAAGWALLFSASVFLSQFLGVSLDGLVALAPELLLLTGPVLVGVWIITIVLLLPATGVRKGSLFLKISMIIAALPLLAFATQILGILIFNPAL